MSSRPNQPVSRPVAIALCLMLASFAAMVLLAASAHAANYRMVLCAADNGSNSYDTATNTASAQHPGGIFDFVNACGPAPDPAGDKAWLRIAEHEASGTAGLNAYGSISWTVPPWVAILGGGGYTREPDSFNDGWRGRFWAEGFDGSGPNNILMQGAGVENSGINASPTFTFNPHLWPFGSYGYYRRFIFELTCMRPAGCDRAGYNAVDANTIVLTLADVSPAQVNFTDTGSAFMQGRWVKGVQNVNWDSFDLGSGIRLEQLSVDGAPHNTVDRGWQCSLGSSPQNTEFARVFQPCPTYGPYEHSYPLDTATLGDGAHSVRVCARDYAQFQGLDGTKGESCEERTVRFDNHAPGTPVNLQVSSANPARYLDHFGAGFSLPADPGSPITSVHYDVIDANGNVVKPAQELKGINPTAIPSIAGPAQAGDYRVRVWLEDEVGHVGPAASAPIPHDTVPPAAPQGLSVTPPDTSRASEGFDVRWHNIQDNGSPIDAAHYQVLNGAGAVVVPTQTVRGDGPEDIASLDTPADRGDFTLRLWLTDAEGNVGAPVSAPLSYECVRSSARGGVQLSATIDGSKERLVEQDQGATLRGSLLGTQGGIAGASLCVFGHTAGDTDRKFLGIALTDSGGEYRFALAAGPSRTFSAVYRPGQRQLSAEATLKTRVKPTLRARKAVIRNGEVAHLEGEIPGPHNDDVTIVIQVRQGKGWLAFRRYRTRNGGHYEADYPFRRTTRPTTYEMRAQVRETGSLPYVEGDSDPLFLRVLPRRKIRKYCVRKKQARHEGKVKTPQQPQCPINRTPRS
jgi:hypothetical protein